MLNEKEPSRRKRNSFNIFLENYSEEAKVNDLKILNKILKNYPKNSRFVIDISEEKRVIIKRNIIYLVNDNYSNVGFFSISISSLNYDYGNLFFNPTETPELDSTIIIYYRNRNELYRLINRFECLGASNKKDFIEALENEEKKNY